MKKLLFSILMLIGISLSAFAQTSAWKMASEKEISSLVRERDNGVDEGELYFTINLAAIKNALVNAPDKFSGQQGVVLEIPNKKGELEKFSMFENSNFEPVLQARFPEIRAYVGKGIDDPYATLHLSISPQGIQTVVFRADAGDEFIERFDKAATAYVLFNSADKVRKTPINCTTVDVHNEIEETTTETNKADNAKYKTMRLALSCVAEYSNYFGATSSAQVGLVLAAMNNTMTRVNGVLEKDLSIHLNIINETTNVIYYVASSDPYSDGATGSGGAWNDELMNNLNGTLGDAAFDIGHLFGASGGGGNAGCIGCVCCNVLATGGGSNSAYKGSGYTSPSNNVPAGDTFDIDYVVHEMGHQLGGNHSFTHGFEGTTAQVEPGSGSTIMGYAGITSYNVQSNSNALFCYKNILQIQTNLNQAIKTCPVTTVLTGINATPTANAGLDYTIPIGTAFRLDGVATDADTGDVLTYVWEQNDVGTSATTNANSRVLATKTVGPNFRTFKASANNFRYFPQMGKIISGTIAITTGANTNWESVSNVARTLNFTFTARDNHAGMGQTKTDASKVTVNASGGPFVVTSQGGTTSVSYEGSTQQTVTWNVANTTAAPFNTATVDILISTNASTALETISSGVNPTTWTTIASGVPNNGSALVTLPYTATTLTACRFMVKAVGNVFLAINSRNFTITPSLSSTEFGFDNFALYPNPNNGNFTVAFNSNSANSAVEILLHDIRGRKVFDKTYTNTGIFEQTLSLSNLEAGIYLVTVKEGANKIVKKIVIE